MLAGDVEILQNFADPEDADGDGEISPADVLRIVNRLNRGVHDAESDAGVMYDVDGDGHAAPLDALLVINRLNNHSRVSAIAPEARATNLQHALDSGKLPLHLARDKALEMLQTLSHGGRWEIGERFRDGKMTHQEDAPQRVADGESVEGDLTGAGDATAPANDLLEPLDTDRKAESEFEDGDLLNWLPPVDDLQPLFDPTLWQSTIQEHTPSLAPDELEEHVRSSLAERLRTAADSEHLPDGIDVARLQDIADRLEAGETPIQDILVELHAAPAEAQPLRDRIAQIFANVDIDAIVDQVRVDLATLIEARTGEQATAEHDAAITEFFRTPPFGIF